VKFLDEKGLSGLLEGLAREYELFGPVRVGDRLVLGRLDVDGEVRSPGWNAYRLPESLKPLFFGAGRVLASWTPEGPRAGPPPRPRAVIGARACDLQALHILDHVLMNHRYREPGWCRAREQNVILSGDCTGHGASCFCTMLGGAPHPESHFDLNLGPVSGGYVVESGSAKGEELLAQHAVLFREATAAEVEARDARRREVAESVRAQNARWPVKEAFEVSVEKNLKTEIWGRLAATCVECNACNMVCPTCHCFMLLDVVTAGGAERISLWDSCFQAGYARMAGGGTPRLQLTERFKNHYYHKFVSFPRNWGITACSGCGRCVDACMGRIDKRECLHRLEAEWIPSEVLEEVE
jgi:formate hydrogenlyase subunit 6/NADH:ubiquinone oxidoreductase subunit I